MVRETPVDCEGENSLGLTIPILTMVSIGNRQREKEIIFTHFVYGVLIARGAICTVLYTVLSFYLIHNLDWRSLPNYDCHS